jgi:hypothetical protein
MITLGAWLNGPQGYTSNELYDLYPCEFDSVKVLESPKVHKTEVQTCMIKSQCKEVLEETPHKSSKSDQITKDQFYYG